jgi:peptidoglycan/xylan/chitin deacetylase (PgdA/CDA1 family)/GT2 family glycosyltransferase
VPEHTPGCASQWLITHEWPPGMVELSVVIPTYNRAGQLRAGLDALARQTRPAETFEVIVVVDGSVDDTREMLAGLAPPYALRVAFQKNSGQHVARNHGVRLATGRYCLFLDDDIVADPRLVAEHLRAHDGRDDVVCIGQLALVVPPAADWFVRSYAEGWQAHYAELNTGRRQPTWEDCFGGNVSLPCAAFLALGGFAPDFRRSHDIELGYRLQQRGFTFVYSAAAIGTQDERKDVRELANDARKAGAAWTQLCRVHPEMAAQLLAPVLEVSLRERALRRVCRALRGSPSVLAWIGSLTARASPRTKWYRFMRGYFYWLGIREAAPDCDAWVRPRRSIPILMYHAFGGPDETPSRYIVPGRRFAWQMALLRWMGYRVITLDELVRQREEAGASLRRSAVITIDDGYVDVSTYAFPVLHRYGFPATVFLVSAAVGGCNGWSHGTELTNRPLLSWAQIKAMQGAGVSYGAHTRTHPDLTGVTPNRAREEILSSKVELEQALGIPIRFFAYPYGAVNPLIQAHVEQAGYWAALGVEEGRNTPLTAPYALRRIEIRGTDSLLRFALSLWSPRTAARFFPRRESPTADGVLETASR